MSGELEAVREVVEALERMIARDGGSLKLIRYDPNLESVVIEFHQGVNEECATCVVDVELVEAFLREGFQTAGIAVSSLAIESSQGVER